MVRRWPDGQTAIAHCWQRYGRLTICCYLVKGNITLLLVMQNAIIKYKGLPVIVIVVLPFNNRGMFERYSSDMPQRQGMSDQSGCNNILRYIFFKYTRQLTINFSGASYMWKHSMYAIKSDLGNAPSSPTCVKIIRKGHIMRRPPTRST